MKRFALGVSIVLGFAMGGVVGCDDDDTDNVAMDGGADTAVAGQCVGTFNMLTRTQLGAATMPTGQCAAAADLNIICSRDVRAITGACGQSCFLGGMADVPACTNMCVAKELDPDLSAGCSNCYTNAVVCTLNNCASPCAADPSSSTCISCQANAGCLSTFFSCSGLPGAQPPRPDAGADASSMDATTTDATAG